MADKSMILSAEAEAALLKPIDEYVGKIQKQIDALRVDGSDKVRSLKNHIAIAKEDKNLTKEERAKIIAKDKADQINIILTDILKKNFYNKICDIKIICM